MTAAKAGNSYIPNNASGYGGMSTVGSAPSANAVAAKGSVPYIPSTSTGGGMSVLPNATSAKTGLPYSTTAPQASMGSNAGTYVPPPSAPYTPTTSSPKSTYVASRSSSTNSPSSSPSAFGLASATSPSSASSGTSAPPPSYSGSTSAGYGSPATAPSGTTPSYRQQYLDMLSGVYSDDDLKSAQKNLFGINKKQADAQQKERDQEDYINANEKGQGLRTFNGDLDQLDKKSAKELADLAIAAKPYQSYIDTALGAAKTAADYEGEDAKNNAPFTLGQNESRYVYDQTTGQYKQVGSSASASGAADDQTIQAWAKYVQDNPAQIGSVPSDIRNSVVAALGNQPASSNPVIQEAENKARTLIGDPASGQGGLIDKAIAGVGDLTTGLAGTVGNKIPGTSGYDLEQTINTIKANLTVDTLQAMRAASPTGGALGAISDKEDQLLAATVANLSTSQSKAQLLENLNTIKTHYQNWLNIIKSSEGGGSSSTGGSGGGLYSF